jgi:hypothetical protein
MFRAGVILTVFLGLAAWAGGQGPPLSTGEQLDMLRANRALIDGLIDQSVEMAAADTPLKRAAAGQNTAGTLAGAIASAAEAGNPDRVAEFGGHLETVVRDALIPNLTEARRTITPGSPDALRLEKIHDDARTGLDDVRNTLETPGKIGDDATVQELRRKLDALREVLSEKK